MKKYFFSFLFLLFLTLIFPLKSNATLYEASPINGPPEVQYVDIVGFLNGDCSSIDPYYWWKTSLDACNQFLGSPINICCQPGQNCTPWQFSYANGCQFQLGDIETGTCKANFQYTYLDCAAVDRCNTGYSTGTPPNEYKVYAGQCDATKYTGSNPSTACVSGGWYKSCCTGAETSPTNPLGTCSVIPYQQTCSEGNVTSAGQTSCVVATSSFYSCNTTSGVCESVGNFTSSSDCQTQTGKTCTSNSSCGGTCTPPTQTYYYCSSAGCQAIQATSTQDCQSKTGGKTCTTSSTCNNSCKQYSFCDKTQTPNTCKTTSSYYDGLTSCQTAVNQYYGSGSTCYDSSASCSSSCSPVIPTAAPTLIPTPTPAPVFYYCNNGNTCTSSSSCPAGQTCYTSSTCDGKCTPKIYQCQNQSCSATSFTSATTCTSVTGKTCYASADCGGRTCSETFYTCANPGSPCTSTSPGTFASAQECQNATGKPCYGDSTTCNSNCQNPTFYYCSTGSCNATLAYSSLTACSSAKGSCYSTSACNGACTSLSSCGGSCNGSNNCQSGLTCNNLKCTGPSCPCTNNSSCPSGQQCVNGSCKNPVSCNGACTVDSECLSGYTCTATGSIPPKVCRKSSCTTDSTCTCASSGAQCSASSPCPDVTQNGSTYAQCCSSGTCSIICTSCPSQAPVPPYSSTGSTCKKLSACLETCQTNLDCQSGLFCDQSINQCRNLSCPNNKTCNCSVCTISSDCPPGQTCQSGACAVPAMPTSFSLYSCGEFNPSTDSNHMQATITWSGKSLIFLQATEGESGHEETWLFNEWVAGGSKTLTVSTGKKLYVKEGDTKKPWSIVGSCRGFFGYVIVDENGKNITSAKQDPGESCYQGNPVNITLDDIYSFIHSSTATCNVYSYAFKDVFPSSHKMKISIPNNYQLSGISVNDGAPSNTQPVTVTNGKVNFGIKTTISIPTPTPTPVPTLAPTPTITPTPIPQKPWIKVKGSSFQRLRGATGIFVSGAIPSSPLPFDADDTGEAYFLIGESTGDKAGGVMMATTLLGKKEATLTSSGFYDIDGYPSHFLPFDYGRFIRYIISKKDYTSVQKFPEDITKAGVYLYESTDGSFLFDLIFSSSTSFPSVPLVLATEKTVYITGNIAPPSPLAILAKSIVINSSVSQIKAILIADTIETGVNDNLGLKVVGNLSTKNLEQGREQQATLNKKPSIFITHDLQQYMDLLPYLSVVQEKRWERN